MLRISEYFCPNEQCKDYGLCNQGNIVKAGTYPKGESRNQLLKCKVCGRRFTETRNTVFAHCHYSEKEVSQIISCVIEGNGIRATSRITGKSKNGVNRVILKAGEHAEMILGSLLSSLYLEECQLDELWAFVNKKRHCRRKI